MLFVICRWVNRLPDSLNKNWIKNDRTTKRSTKLFYANGLEVAVTSFDCNIKFLRHGTANDTPVTSGIAQNKSVPVIYDSLTVAVSPVFAKVLLSGLYNSIKQHEDINGIIPMPIEFAKLYDDMFKQITK